MTGIRLLPLTADQMRGLGVGRHAEVAAQIELELSSELVAGPWWGHRADLLDADPRDTRSAIQLIVREGVVVGSVGFHGPPDAAGIIEVGYTVLPAHRRQGMARAALSAMVDQARRDPSVRVVRATGAPDNEASLGLVRSAGFVHTGEQMDDEDGRELVFELDVGPDAWRTDNRAFWDAAAPAHAAGAFYDLPGFVSNARDDLRPFEDAELGPVDGLDLVHLQCHLGMDTLSLARRGARVTGLDLSAGSIAVARRLAAQTGLTAEFVVGDVLDAVDALGGRRFDVVYTGIGALCWLPDLAAWAAVIARLLRPGALLYLVEVHPMVDAVWDDADGWTLRRDMTGTALVPEPVSGGTYAAPDATLPGQVAWSRNPSLGEVVTAVAGAGLRVELLAEQTVTDNPLPWLERGPDRLFRFPPGRPVYPVTFSLRARAPN